MMNHRRIEDLEHALEAAIAALNSIRNTMLYSVRWYGEDVRDTYSLLPHLEKVLNDEEG